jgi:hypothetical protein
MIYKTTGLLPLFIAMQTIQTAPNDITIDIDDEKTKEQEYLLQERRNLKNYINQQQNQQWAKYDEITNCCCLTSLCLANLTQFMEPCIGIVSDEISLLTLLSTGAFILAIDRYTKPDCLQEQERVRNIDDQLKEKVE